MDKSSATRGLATCFADPTSSNVVLFSNVGLIFPNIISTLLAIIRCVTWIIFIFGEVIGGRVVRVRGLDWISNLSGLDFFFRRGQPKEFLPWKCPGGYELKERPSCWLTLVIGRDMYRNSKSESGWTSSPRWGMQLALLFRGVSEYVRLKGSTKWRYQFDEIAYQWTDENVSLERFSLLMLRIYFSWFLDTRSHEFVQSFPPKHVKLKSWKRRASQVPHVRTWHRKLPN